MTINHILGSMVLFGIFATLFAAATQMLGWRDALSAFMTAGALIASVFLGVWLLMS